MHITLTKYADLLELLRQYRLGIFEILILEGQPGTGKTTLVRQAFADLPPTHLLWLEGRITAAKLYELLYQYQDRQIVIDDSQGILTDKQSQDMLKSLCNTSQKEKTVSWSTTRKLPEGIPRSFPTASQVVIIGNDTRSLSVHTKALADRGLYILFHPTPDEIHTYAQAITDPVVYQFLERYFPLIKDKDLSLRTYVLLSRMQERGLHWTETFCQFFQFSEGEKLYIEVEMLYPSYAKHEQKWVWIQKSSLPEIQCDRIADLLERR